MGIFNDSFIIIQEEVTMETDLSGFEKNRIKKEVKEAFNTIII